MKLTGVGKEETTTTGATPKFIFFEIHQLVPK